MKIYNNIKRKLSKYDIIIVAIIMALGISIYTIGVKFNVYDELWNMCNTYKMYNGGLIYKDCNIIITPLFFFIGKIIFNVLGANYLTFRIYNILIFTALLVVSYILFRKLDLNKRYAFFNTLILYLLSSQIISSGANYNVLVLVFVVIGLIFQISNRKENTKTIIQGIVIFFTFFTKQNVGIYYAIGLVIYYISIGIKEKNIKHAILRIILSSGISLALLIISIMFMYIKGNLYDFINYAFLGITEFSRNFAIEHEMQLLNLFIQIIFIMLINIVINKLTKINNNKKYNLIFIMSIICMLIQFPIFNTYHYILSCIIIMIYVLAIIYEILEKNMKLNKLNKIVIVVNIISIVLILGIGTINIFLYSNGNLKRENLSSNNIYFGANLSQEQEKDIQEVCNYIIQQKNDGIDVKIISYRAMEYMMPLKINNKEFDLVFLGNLGKDGEDGIIQKINQMKNTQILIVKDENDAIYQESKKIRNNIIENLEKNGEIGDFVIYKSAIYNK